MNEVIHTLTDHRSIRQYSDQPVTSEQIDIIVQAAQAAPSSINGQQVTIIEVQDKEKKRKISELTGNQTWIDQAPVFLLFCADFYRAKLAAEKTGQKLEITYGMESILVGATDVGIALANAIAAAESLELGTVPIGAVRRDPMEMMKLLDIPEFVFPVVGLVVGHPTNPSEKKPRLPQEAVHHKEKYNTDLKELIDQYDHTVSEYMKDRTGGKEARGWSQTIMTYYNSIYFSQVREMLENQGFAFKK